MDEFIEIFGECSVKDVVFIIIALSFLVGVLIKAIKYINQVHDNIQEERKKIDTITTDLVDQKESNKKEINDLIESISNMKKVYDTNFDALFIANREIIGDKIEQKTRYYIERGGIPEDEIDGFISLYDAYKSIGGNHGRDIKFKKVMNMYTNYTLDEHGNVTIKD